MRRHRVQPFVARRTERVGIRARYKPRSNWIFLDIAHAVSKLLRCRYLAFVETPHPNIHLALQAKGKTALNKLHGLLKGNLRSRCDQRVEMIWHDDIRMKKKPSLSAIVEQRLPEQLRISRHLKQPTPLRRNCGHQISAGLLRRKTHCENIQEVPGAPSFAHSRRVGNHKSHPRSCLCFSVCHSRQGGWRRSGKPILNLLFYTPTLAA